MTHTVEIDLNGDRSQILLNGAVVDNVRAVGLVSDPDNPVGPLLLQLTIPVTVLTKATTQPVYVTTQPVPTPPVETAPEPVRTRTRFTTEPIPDTCDQCTNGLLREDETEIRFAAIRNRRWLCSTCRTPQPEQEEAYT